MDFTRQDTVVNTALLKKNTKKVCSAILLRNSDLIEKALASSLDYPKVADEIVSYIKTDPDILLYEPLMQLTDMAPVWDYLEDPERDKRFDKELKSIAQSIDRLQDYGRSLHRGGSNGHKNLTPYFSNDKAEELLNRAVAAGFLKENYMPAEGTMRFQLKLIALAMNKIMGYGYRDKWCHFHDLWEVDLARCWIPLTKGRAIQAVAHLYPEANIWESIIPKKGQSKLMNDLTEEQATKLFRLLKKNGYIENNTKLECFLSVLNFSEFPYVPVNWTYPRLSSLIYFVKVLFQKTNPDLFKRLCDCFTINGHPLNYGTLKTQSSYVNKHKDRFTFVPELDRIIYVATGKL